MGSNVRALYFALTLDQLKGSIDLRGCRYDWLEGPTETILKKLHPFDRQPYSHLERVLRSAGEDRAANTVYLKMRELERKQKWQQRELGGWLFSLLYALVANYGVRPYRLILFPTVLLFLGTIVFLQPGAVSPRPIKPTNNSAAVVSQLTPWDACLVSLRYFLPVDVPVATQWVPTDHPVSLEIGISRFTFLLDFRPSVFATFYLKLPGWILVPLGIAALTGLLRRVTR